MVNPMAELFFIPAPGVGHIISTVEIAKLLVNRDQRLSITVLIITPPFDSGIAAYIQSLANKTIQRIQFIELPRDGAPTKPDPEAPMSFLIEFIDSHCKHVRKVVADSTNRIAGFVIDMFCTSMIDVANEFNIPTYVFFTSNAAFLGFKFYIQKLCDDSNKSFTEFCDSDDVEIVPSFVKPVPKKVFPMMAQSKEGLDFVLRAARKLRQAKGIMLNTFLELETHAIESLASDSGIPTVYPVGPVLNLEGGAGNAKNEKSESDVMRWLDGQPPSSVVVLCFGSMGCFEEVQVKEIAVALERSGHRFVWSLRRPPLPEQMSKVPGDYEDVGVVLPEGFLERTGGVGKVIGWAPQVALLSHSAVGGFVSHCGWNSTLESLWFGVPLATWPLYAEQQMNAFEMVVELGLAVEIKLDYKKDFFNQNGNNTVIVTADEIERGIRRLMDDGESEVRKKVKEMSKKSRVAVAEGGSSYTSIGCIIQDFMSNIS